MYPFLKGHGTENDFVLLPDHDGSVHGDLSPEEMAARLAAWTPPAPRVTTGALAKYARLVSSASVGAVTS